MVCRGKMSWTNVSAPKRPCKKKLYWLEMRYRTERFRFRGKTTQLYEITVKTPRMVQLTLVSLHQNTNLIISGRFDVPLMDTKRRKCSSRAHFAQFGFNTHITPSADVYCETEDWESCAYPTLWFIERFIFPPLVKRAWRNISVQGEYLQIWRFTRRLTFM